MKKMTTLLTALLLLVAAVSCGSRNGNSLQADARRGFSMQVLPQSFESGGSAEFRMEVQKQEDRILLSVHVDDAEALSHAYLEIGYDSEQWRPVDSRSAGLMGPGAIKLLAGDGQGRVQYGEVQPGSDPLGADGSGLLATIEFAPGPDLQRRSSAVADDVVEMDSNPLYNTASWFYTNTGDYDQNGEVNIADLTPLGANLGESGPFSKGMALYMVDGDGNGEINIADITPIAQNFFNRCDGYTLYAGPDGEGHPPAPADPNGPAAREVVHLELSDAELQQGARRYFRHTDPQPDYGDRYWVRATADADNGPASSMTAEWERQWHSFDVADYPSSFSITQPRIEIVAGRPALAWSAGSGSKSLFYSRSMDSRGLGWPDPVLVAGNYTDAWYPELGVIDGRPAISLPVDALEDCYYTIATDVDGSSWSTMVKSTESKEEQLALLEIDGRPLAFGHNGGSTLYQYHGNAPDATNFNELSGLNYERGSILQQGDSFLVLFKDSTDGFSYMRRYFWDGLVIDSEPAVLVDGTGSNMRPTAFVEYGGGLLAVATFGIGNTLQQYAAMDPQGSSWGGGTTTNLSGTGQFLPVMVPAYGGLMTAWTDLNSMQVASAYNPDGDPSNWEQLPAVIDSVPVVERKEMERVGPHPCMAFVEEDAEGKHLRFFVFF